MGADRVTVRNLKVLRVDAENNLLLVEGSVPGGPNAIVVIRKAIAAKTLKVAQVEPVEEEGSRSSHHDCRCRQLSRTRRSARSTSATRCSAAA